MKNKLNKLKEYSFIIRNNQPKVIEELMDTKIQELMKFEKWRKVVILFIGSVFGYVLSCLLNSF